MKGIIVPWIFSLESQTTGAPNHQFTISWSMVRFVSKNHGIVENSSILEAELIFRSTPFFYLHGFVGRVK